ncbi:MAG: phosphatase PAP2 family protein [Symploca sp. SIO1B1]|nr:phosphatase PAP2 family protein [Symploca sp. SIO1B1]
MRDINRRFLLLGVVLPVMIFGILTYQVWGEPGGILWDEPILLAIRTTANPQLDAIAKTMTQFGWVVFPLVMVTVLILLKQQFWRSLPYGLMTMLGSVIISLTGKSLIHRPPPHLWNSPASGANYSFPSGHAIYTMTAIAILVILSWESKWRWLVLVVGGLFVLMIGWTRLYLGFHYPSDILASWMISVAWAIGASLLVKIRI